MREYPPDILADALDLRRAHILPNRKTMTIETAHADRIEVDDPDPGHARASQHVDHVGAHPAHPEHHHEGVLQPAELLLPEELDDAGQLLVLQLQVLRVR